MLAGVEATIDSLLKSPEFTAAVVERNLQAAAAAAAAVFQRQSSGDEVNLKHTLSGASTSGYLQDAPIRVGDRVALHSCAPSTQPLFAGRAREATVVATALDGTMTLRLGAAEVQGGGYVKQTVPQQQPAGGLHRMASNTDGKRFKLSTGGAPLLARGEERSRESLRQLRSDILAVEEKVPWNAVRRVWRGRRATWRRAVRTTEQLQELAGRIQELFMALATDDVSLPGCGASWRASMDSCRFGQVHSTPLLSSLWDEFRTALMAWLDSRARPLPAFTSEQLQRNAARAIRAMQAAAAQGPEALQQVPLECIMQSKKQGLAMVRSALEAQRNAALRAAADGLPAPDTPLSSPGSIAGGGLWVAALESLDSFDSGGESEAEDNSEVTDMEDSDCDVE